MINKYPSRCRRVYQARRGPHVCDDDNVYCRLCHQNVPNQHECTWAPVTDNKRAAIITRQNEWKFGFYDIETSQCDENDDGTFVYRRHYCTTIVLIKVSFTISKCALTVCGSFISSLQVCYLCYDKPISDHCVKCHTREIIFSYSLDDQDVYKVSYKVKYRKRILICSQVVEDFCNHLVTDSTIPGRDLYAHNGGIIVLIG